MPKFILIIILCVFVIAGIVSINLKVTTIKKQDESANNVCFQLEPNSKKAEIKAIFLISSDQTIFETFCQ